MEIKLVYLDDFLGKAWEKSFSGIDNVSIINEDITKVKSDAIVSPANSFGFLVGIYKRNYKIK